MYKRYSAFIFTLWLVIPIIIGIAIPYYVIDISSKVVDSVGGFVKPYFFSDKASQRIVAESGNNISTTSKNLGSDDADIVTFVPAPTDVSTSTIATSSSGSYTLLSINTRPRTSAKAYLVADIDTGETIISKEPDHVWPIASVTKLMNALVTITTGDLHKTTIVTKEAYATYGSLGGLKIGEKIILNDLLYPLLLESSNDAAEVIAYAYGHDNFMKALNAKAKDIGMDQTYYDDPSGLSEKNVSTANDLFKLASYILTHQPNIFDITRIREYVILHHSWLNQNFALRYENFLGGKNGFTYEASNTMVGLFDMPLTVKEETKEGVTSFSKNNIVDQNNKRRIVIILLKTEDRAGDTDRIMRYLKNNVRFYPNQVFVELFDAK